MAVIYGFLGDIIDFICGLFYCHFSEITKVMFQNLIHGLFGMYIINTLVPIPLLAFTCFYLAIDKTIQLQ